MTLVGGAIVGAFGVATKGAMSFGKGMAEVASLGVKDLEKLKVGVEAAATGYGVDLADGINATYQALSSGVPEKNVPDFLIKASKAATAGVTDLSKAVELGTTTVNVFGGDVGKAFDQAFVAVKDGRVRFDDLNASIGQVAPLFKAAGLASDELFASFATLTLQGIKAESAAAGLKAALSNIIKPAGDVQKLAAQLGIDFSTTGLKAKGLSGFMADLQEKTGGNIDTMSKLFGSVEGLNVMLNLTSKDGSQKFNKALSDMRTGVSATDEAYQAMIKNDPTYAWKIMSGEIQVLAMRIGSALLPALQKFADFLIPIVKGVTEFAQAHKVLTAALTLTAAAFGGLMVAAAPVMMMLPGLSIAFGGVGAAAAGASAAIGGGAAVGAVAGACGLAGVLAVGAPLALGLALIVPLVWEMGKAFYAARDAADGAKQAKLGEIDTLYKLEIAMNHAGVEYDAAKVRAMDTGDAIQYLTGIYNKHKLEVSGTAEQVKDAHKKMLEASMQRLKQESEDLKKSESLWVSWGGAIYDAISSVINWIKNLIGWQSRVGAGGFIPAYASGGYVTSPALHQTIFAGEEGPELATFPSGRRAILTAGMYNVPTGTYINTAAQTASRLNSSSRGGNVNVNINLSGNLRNNDDVARISRSIARQVRTSLVGAI